MTIIKEKPGRWERRLDFLGGCVDAVFLTPPRLARPFRPMRTISREDYEKQVRFYVDQGFVDNPARFFHLDDTCPEYRIVSETPYKDGVRQVLAFQSAYQVKNPLIEEEYRSIEANHTGYLVRWVHPKQDPVRKTVLCLHGYMLGEPHQAQKMFHMDKLYDLGLDLALFIAPFHWKRAARGALRRGWFMRVDHVGFTAEAMGQAMDDLNRCLSILKTGNSGPVGLIGASMGGYFSALYSALTDRHAFAVMMVPAVNFSKPYGTDFARLPFSVDETFRTMIRQVWDFHAPLNISEKPVLSPDRMLIVASRGDRLCPFEYVRTLQETWNITNCHYMTGGHWLVFNEKIRGRAWYGFLKDMDFIS